MESLDQLLHSQSLLLLAKALLALSLGIALAFFVRSRLRALLYKRDKMLAGFIAQVLFIALILLSLLSSLGTLGVQTSSILTLLGTAGLAIALGLKDSLSSLASGVILIILRPFRIGDTIELGNLRGVVQSVNLFRTSLLLENQTQAILPNEALAKGNIINHSHSQAKSLNLSLSLQTNQSPAEIKALILPLLPQDMQLQRPPKLKILNIKNDSLSLQIQILPKHSGSSEAIIEELLLGLRESCLGFEIGIKEG